MREQWPDAPLEEVTVEANPDDLSLSYLAALRREGANRLSIGIQSFLDRDLQWMHRRHDARTAVEAVKAARRAGFGNLSIDLIYGVPQMTREEWRYNLEQALELQPEHISAYHLTIEPQTPFGRQARRGTLREADPETSRAQFALLREMLAGRVTNITKFRTSRCRNAAPGTTATIGTAPRTSASARRRTPSTGSAANGTSPT